VKHFNTAMVHEHRVGFCRARNYDVKATKKTREVDLSIWNRS